MISNTFLAERVARVLRVERRSCLVLGPDGPCSVHTIASVAVGDFILIDEHGRMVELLPRRTEIRRLTPGGQSVEQVLAANVDVVAVCVPLEYDPRFARIERFLAIAWASGATPLLVATKADLCPPLDLEPALAQLRAIALGVEVVAVSINNPASLDPLRAAAGHDRTLAVLGASGVGKSSLINALLGEERLATTDIREDGKGRHTTAWRELVAMPGGGFLIDTPGLRGVGMADSQEGVDAVFADVVDVAEQCRFNDCRHDAEPGCAIVAAITAGDLDPERFLRHRKLQKELDYQARRFDARAQAVEREKWKSITKAQRARHNPKT